jgi:uncharacterized membrane protein
MTEETNVITRKIDAHYITAIIIGAWVGAAIGLLYGGVAGFQFIYGHEIFHPITDLIGDELPIYFFGIWFATRVSLPLASDIAGAAAGGVLGAIGGAVIGAAISFGLRVLYDMARSVNRQR